MREGNKSQTNGPCWQPKVVGAEIGLDYSAIDCFFSSCRAMAWHSTFSWAAALHQHW